MSRVHESGEKTIFASVTFAAILFYYVIIQVYANISIDENVVAASFPINKTVFTGCPQSANRPFCQLGIWPVVSLKRDT